MFLAIITIFETEWHYFVPETTNFLIRKNTCVLKHQRSILLYWAAGKYSYLRWNLALWWDNECFILFSGWYFICNMPYVSTSLTIIVCRSKSFFKHIKAIQKVPGLSKALSSIIIIIHKENVITPKASSNCLENDPTLKKAKCTYVYTNQFLFVPKKFSRGLQ